MARIENFLTLYVDPGETTGWALAKGTNLMGSEQTPMWDFADAVWTALTEGLENSYLGDPGFLRSEDAEHLLHECEIGRVVCEDFRLYPHVMRTGALDWNPVRTARLIGALTFMCRLHDIPFILQPAAIKPDAEAAGAKELYVSPVYENRHQNDAIQHFVYYINTEILGIKLRPTAEERREATA